MTCSARGQHHSGHSVACTLDKGHAGMHYALGGFWGPNTEPISEEERRRWNSHMVMCGHVPMHVQDQRTGDEPV